MTAKALLNRLAAVLLAGTLGLAPLSCCCAETDAQQLETHAQTMATMEGMSAEMAHDHHGPASQQMPDDDHICPHKLTANLDTGKAPIAPFVASAPVPVIYTIAAATAFNYVPANRKPFFHIKPPPHPAGTLVSQHVLLLA